MTADSGAHEFDDLPDDVRQQVLASAAEISQRIAAIDPDLVLKLTIGTQREHDVGVGEDTPDRESIINERWSAKIWPKVEFMKLVQHLD